MAYRVSALLVCVLFLSACGGDPYENAAKESANVMEDMVEILEGVTDKASAEAAKGKLEKLAAKMKDMQAELMKLGPPTPEQQKKMMETAMSMQAESQVLAKRLQEAMQRISADPETMAVLQSTLRGMK